MITGLGVVAYNRPEHTLRVLSAIKNQNPDLPVHLFIDAPTSETDQIKQEQLIRETRGLGLERLQFQSHSKNLGLRGAILFAMDYLTTKYDAAILLEDDCVPLDGFFDFMSWGLGAAKFNFEIRSLLGYQVPGMLQVAGETEPVITPRFIPWGWATWSDRWEDYPRTYRRREELVKLAQKNQNLPTELSHSFSSVAEKPDAWSPDWIATHYATDTWALSPARSLVDNIGFDGSGTHPLQADWFRSSSTRSKGNLVLDLPTQPEFLHPNFQAAALVDTFMRDRWLKTLTLSEESTGDDE